jgi:hypothetical protein
MKVVKMKKFRIGIVFLIGFLLGAVIFNVTPIKAALEEYICYKAEYKVIINGKE